MSAAKESGKQTTPVPNSERGYAVSIHAEINWEYEIPERLILNMEDIKRCVDETLSMESSWGESRSRWDWRLDHKRTVCRPLGGTQVLAYHVQTHCNIKHSQIHAFENFVLDVMLAFSNKFPKVRIWIQPIFSGLRFYIGEQQEEQTPQE